MRSVLVSAFTPTLSGGQGLRTYAIAHVLASRDPLTIVYSRFGAEKPAPEYSQLERVQLVEVEPGRGARRALAFAKAMLNGVPADIARGASTELLEAARDSAEGPAHVVADGPVAAATLLPLARKRDVTYNAHNFESAFRHEEAAGGRRGSRRLRRFERNLLVTFSESWMASVPDVECARSLAPSANVRYVPNVIDVSAILPTYGTREGPRRTLLFVGDLEYAPNLDAVRYLIEDVMPRLWKIQPNGRLRVVGRGAERVGHVDRRIELAGFVDDLPAEYERSDCVVIPLRAGGGSPLKFIEALAYGRPVVATSKSAAGLDLEGDEFIQADDPDALASAIDAVLSGDHSGMAARGREAVEQLYSIEALRARLDRDL